MWRKLILLGFLGLLLGVLVGCDPNAPCTDAHNPQCPVYQQNAAQRTRAEAYAKALAVNPQPIPNNFLARRMLIKYVERQDTPDHPFYVYVLGQTGNVVGYYVSQAAPVNVCAFLSYAGEGDPSLDGIFYGGSGSSSGCDGWFIFDAATDALIVVYGGQMFVSDQPLRLEAKPITVQTK